MVLNEQQKRVLQNQFSDIARDYPFAWKRIEAYRTALKKMKKAVEELEK